MLREDLRLSLPERPCCREVMLREDPRLSLPERPCCREGLQIPRQHHLFAARSLGQTRSKKSHRPANATPHSWDRRRPKNRNPLQIRAPPHPSDFNIEVCRGVFEIVFKTKKSSHDNTPSILKSGGAGGILSFGLFCACCDFLTYSRRRK